MDWGYELTVPQGREAIKARGYKFTFAVGAQGHKGTGL